jgi:ankyrin repeat protein
MVHTLHKMVEAALTSKAGVKWGHVLHYLDAHCEESETRDSTVALPYQSPLPAYYVASEDLAKQLRPDGVTGESVLRTALKGAPARVIAALCQLGPQALEVTDHRGRLPLHLACRRTAEDPETETVLTILVDVFPLALLHRDDGGRTPLHWLFWYQAPSRSPEITSKFCQALPKAKFYALKQHHDTDKKYPLPEIPRPSAANKVPHNAAIIPDARLGCLPIHFAVMEGANDAVIQVLLQAYPMGKNVCDRFGRTVCHWYLGAGYVRPGCSHVSGEARDPNAPEWWNRELSLDTLRLVLSSRVARTADCLDRHPLHWACELLACNYYRGTPEFVGKCISLPAIQLLLDHHIGQLTSQDHESQTPIMVMLDTIGRLQDSDWKLNGSKDRTFDLVHGGPTAFDPPLALVHMLLTYPDSTAETQPGMIEDERGRLPIHAALAIAASPAVIDLLIQNNPMALVHTTEESLQAPLHAAFSRPWIAPLQSVETVELVLRTYTADKYGTAVDGRLAMKMEDAAGSYPLHYACQNKACVEVVKMLVEKYPMTASLQNSDGDLPLHCLLEDDVVKAITSTSTVPDVSKEDELTDNFETTRQKIAAMIHPLIWDASKLGVAGSKHGMMPLHIAVLFGAAPYSALLRLLELNSEAASHFTSHPDSASFSVLDLHELHKSRYEGSTEEWQYIRELFFSFTPTLESHRHREELLDHCVRVVINELNGSGSYHSHVPKLPYKNPSVSQMLPPVREGQIVIAISKSPSRKKMSRLPLKPKSKPALRLPNVTKKKKVGDTSESIYDDNDMTLDNYTLSRSKSKDGEKQVVDEEGEDDSYFSEDDGTFSDDGTGTDRQDDETYDDGYGYSDGEYTDQDSRIGGGGESTFDGSFVDQPSLSFNSTYTPLVPLDSRNPTFSSRGSRGSRETHSVHRNGTLSSRASKVTQATLLSYNAFDVAKQNLQEEKKEESEKAGVLEPLITPRLSNKLPAKPPTRPAFLSEVGLRLWTFFVLYSDSNNPSDNYVRQVADIFDETSFTGVGRLIAISLPAYASLYLPSGTDLSGLSFRDIASPKCRELIHKTCYFVGKYDFSLDDAGSRLIHRSSDGNTVVIRASEWIFTTEQTTTAVNPGISEAEIWATGEVPAELGLTFQSRERNVWIKFTKNAEVYKREVGSRVDLDVATEGDMDSPRIAVPLRSHFNAFETERKFDRCYKTDISDERFRELKLFGGIVDSSVSDSIILQEYPYALVYPASGHGSLADYYRQHGMNSTTQIKTICSQVSDALKVMHHTGMLKGFFQIMDGNAWTTLTLIS